MSLPNAITRIENYLKAIAEGTGTHLPDVTSDDNDDVLGVVNGEWEKMANPNIVNIFPLTSAATPTLADGKTMQDLIDAYNAGHIVILQAANRGMTYLMTTKTPQNVPMFMTGGNASGQGALYFLVGSSTMTASTLTRYIQFTVPAVTAADNGKVLKVVDGVWSAETP